MSEDKDTTSELFRLTEPPSWGEVQRLRAKAAARRHYLRNKERYNLQARAYRSAHCNNPPALKSDGFYPWRGSLLRPIPPLRHSEILAQANAFERFLSVLTVGRWVVLPGRPNRRFPLEPRPMHCQGRTRTFACSRSFPPLGNAPDSSDSTRHSVGVLKVFIYCNVVCFLSSTATELAWIPERKSC
jgi:hypothetical protein